MYPRSGYLVGCGLQIAIALVLAHLPRVGMVGFWEEMVHGSASSFMAGARRAGAAAYGRGILAISGSCTWSHEEGESILIAPSSPC